jgi:hypothetical protein
MVEKGGLAPEEACLGRVGVDHVRIEASDEAP